MERRIVSAWSNHDASVATFEESNGYITHDEIERYIRVKEPKADALQFFMDTYGDIDDVTDLVIIAPQQKLTELKSFNTFIRMFNNPTIHAVGHHQAHAANAFFSSTFDDALIITLDGGGVELDGQETAFTAWVGNKNELRKLFAEPLSLFNIGGVWTRCTRYVFGLQSGYPYGHQAGSVMAMAAYGDPKKYENDFLKMFRDDLLVASHKPKGQPAGPNIGTDPVHPYLDKWRRKINCGGEQEMFDLAAGLQSATEIVIHDAVGRAMRIVPSKRLCLAGGVTLNCIAISKIFDWFDIDDIFVTPTPHDGGLTVGACQFIKYSTYGARRFGWGADVPRKSLSPYLGASFTKLEVMMSLWEKSESVEWVESSDESLVDLLTDGKIVSVFGGAAESGRRALGNRSIIADPRDPLMRNKINERIKSRKSYRPIAPSVLREHVAEWFERDLDSPYMSFALRVKNEKRYLVPAILHIDGTARLQTVTAHDNRWYYNFLKLWEKKTMIPMICNSSLNDREPIVNSPDDALNCFLKTELDHLYFYDEKILVSKRPKKQWE